MAKIETIRPMLLRIDEIRRQLHDVHFELIMHHKELVKEQAKLIGEGEEDSEFSSERLHLNKVGLSMIKVESAIIGLATVTDIFPYYE